MAARRGRVAVSITADNSGLHRGLSSAEHDVSRFGKTTEKSISGLHKAAGLALGVTGIGGLAFGIKDLATEAVNAQAEQAKLAVAVKNAGLSWKGHREEVEKNLDAMSRVSGFAKSDLSAALSNMIRTTGGLKDSWKDLSIAMDIARTRHIDLAGAQSLVARAALGNTRALKSLGIEVKPVTAAQDQLKAAQQKLTDEMRNSSGATKDQIRLAKEHLASLKDQAKQQDANASRTRALSILQQKFQGQSAAYAKTSAGSFERARASLQLAEEQIGNALLPTLASASNTVAKLATGFAKDWPQIEKAVKPVAHDIGDVVKGVVGFVKAHPELDKMAVAFAGIALSVKAIEKVGSATGVTRLLGLGKTAATRVTGGGGGVAGALTGRGSPENPMYVVVVGGGGGGGTVSTLARDAETAGAGATAGRLSRIAGRAGGVLRNVGAGAAPFVVAAGATKIVSDLARGPQGSDVGVLERYRKEIDALAKTGDKGGMRKLSADLRSAAQDTQSLSKSRDLKGLATALDQTAKTGNRQGLAQIADSLRRIKVTGDGGALSGIIGDLDKLSRGSKKASVDVGAVTRDTAAHFKELAQDGHTSLTDISQAVKDNMGIVKLRLGSDSKAGRQALATNFEQAAAAITAQMKAGTVATKDGLRLIQQYMAAAFRELGISPKEASSLAGAGITPGDLSGQPAAKTIAVHGKHLPGAATGYIGRPGEHGHDAVPIVVGRGEAILNRHQQAPVDTALRATYGMGLRDLFGKVRRPHYMAQGGYASMVSDANAIDAHHFPYQWGGGHGGFGMQPFDCSGAVSHVLHAGGMLNSPMVSGDLMNWGLPGPGTVTVFANPQHTYMRIGGRYFGTSQSNPGGGAGWFPGSPRAGFVQRHAPVGGVSIPRVKWTGPGGALGAIGQTVLNRTRGAANRVLSRTLASSIAGGGFGGGNVGDSGSRGTGGKFGFTQLERLWVQAGGNPRFAAIMAHVAEAESSGDPSARNPSGATGLWQILGVPFPGDPRDPLTNARMAVAKFRGGGLHPWDASRPAWGRFAPPGMAGGGFVGGDGGSIGDYVMSSSGGVGGKINQIVGGAPAPNGPAAHAHKRARAHHRHHHVVAQADPTAVAVAAARANFQSAVASGVPTRIRAAASRFRTAIGARSRAIGRLLHGADRNTQLSLQRERGTLAGYQKSIATELKRLNRPHKRRRRGAVDLSQDYQAAQAFLTDIQQGEEQGSLTPQQAAQMRQSVLEGALGPRHLFGRLTGADTQQLKLDVMGANAQDVQTALSDVDTQVTLGQLTPDQGAAAKAGIVKAATGGQFGTITPRDLASIQASAAPSTDTSGSGSDAAATMQALTDAIKANTAELKRRTDLVTATNTVIKDQALNALADWFSGTQASQAAHKALVPGAGTVYRA